MNNVGIKISSSWIEFGSSGVLASFFSTICYRLENQKWGSRFPIVMNELYYNEKKGVKYKDIQKFEKEIAIIKEEFLNLSPKDAIWSFEDNILKVPNDKPDINYDAVNLVDYYKHEHNIFDRFYTIIEDMHYYKANCKIMTEKTFILS